jgi:stage V sporulation protein AC
MKYNKESYKKVVEENTPKNDILNNCFMAFVIGGAICTLGEVIKEIYASGLSVEDADAGVMSSCTLVALAALLTGLGLYDKIGKVGGAGTVVPITGFSNSVVSPALEHKKEGYILGTAANLFKLAGPVLVFGYLSSFIAGVLSIVFK